MLDLEAQSRSICSQVALFLVSLCGLLFLESITDGGALLFDNVAFLHQLSHELEVVLTHKFKEIKLDLLIGLG